MYFPVCILVMAHSNEELLRNLLQKLRHPQVFIAVHIDKKSEALFENLKDVDHIRLVQNRVDVKWAHLTQVEATLSSYRELRATGISMDHFLVISGQDYPVRSMQSIVDFLANHKGKSFLGRGEISKQGWAAAMKRYRYHYYIPAEKLWRGIMMLTRIHRKLPFGLKPWGGPQWINMTQQHLDYIVEYGEQHPKLYRYMKTVRFPEEMFFQTLIMNSRYKDDCINNDLRFIKWIAGKSNPEILTIEDYDDVVSAKDKFFARKFDLKHSASLIKKIEHD
jgi:hypothetical protein